MKRWIAVVLAVGMMAGCGTQGSPQKNMSLPTQYEMTARLRYHGFDTQIRLRRAERDQLEFESPAGLRGLCLTMDQNILTMDYGDLKRQFTRGSLPETSVAGILLATLDAAAETGIPADGQCVGPFGEYLLEVEKENGNILKLSIPRQSLDLQVQSFVILEESA